MGLEKPTANLKNTPNLNIQWSLTQRIWLCFILPTGLHCIVYIADVATDIALVEQHFAESRYFLAAATLLFIYAPAVVFLVLTIRDKKRWPKLDNGTGSRTGWIFKQVCLAVVFPIHAIHRFAGKLFWGLEALMGPPEQLEESLAEAMRPSFAELYLLLQPFLQSMPQIQLQTYIVMNYKVPQERTGAVQILSILTSLLSMAIAAAVYMRFETKRSSGRSTPWEFTTKPHAKFRMGPKGSLMTTIESQITSGTAEDTEDAPGSPKSAALPKGVPQSAILSLPPLPPNIRARLLKASGDDLPEELKQEVTNESQPLNIRSSLYGTTVPSLKGDIESLDFTITLPPLPRAPSPYASEPPLSPDSSLPPSPPDDGSWAAPLPPLPPSPPDLDLDNESYEGSVHEAPTNEVTGTTTPDTNLLADNNSKEPLMDQTSLTEEKPTTPTKESVTQPHDIYIESITEEEIVGKTVAFIWWLLFIMSRVLALSTLAFFYPVAFIIISLLHYLGMTTYLFSCGNSDKTSTKILRFALGFVFLYCFIEVRDCFKDPRSFSMGFVVLCSLENVVSSMVWYLMAAWTSWWFLYSFYLINFGLLLSIAAMALFHVLLKPNDRGKA